MDRKEILANAINALLAQKLRSALAVLGIVVGIGLRPERLRWRE